MKKSELEDGVIYSSKYRTYLLVSTRLVECHLARGRHTYRWAADGAKIKKSSSFYSERWEVGYLVLHGSLEGLEQIDCAPLREALDKTGANYAELDLPSGVYQQLIFSIAQLEGPARQIADERTEAELKRRRADREKTRQYNEVIWRLNQFMPDGIKLRTQSDTGNAWGNEMPSIRMTLSTLETLAEGIERAVAESHGRGLDLALQSFAEREVAGEIIIVPTELGDEE